jgi:hypothetical protein
MVWHSLTYGEADRFADDQQVAAAFFAHAYRVGVKNLPDGQSALAYTRHHLDRLKLGQELERLKWGKKRYKLPPSQLAG